MFSLQSRYNERDGVSNHRRLDYLLNRLFRRKSNKTPKPHVTDLCEGIHRWPVNSPHKGSVTWKMFPFDDVMMSSLIIRLTFCSFISLLVTHKCDSKLGQNCFRQWLIACSAPIHYLYQYWIIVNWTIRNKLRNLNTKTFHPWECIL